MNRCEGTGMPIRNAKRGDAAGSKFFGKVYGDCSVCGRYVRARKGTTNANPHNPPQH